MKEAQKLQAGPLIGVWEFDAVSQRLSMSSALADELGSPATVRNDGLAFLFGAEKIEAVLQSLQTSIDTGAEGEFRHSITAKGRVLPVCSKFQPLPGANGRTDRLVGATFTVQGAALPTEVLWSTNLISGEMEWPAAIAHKMGLPPKVSLDTFLERLPESDRASFVQALADRTVNQNVRITLYNGSSFDLALVGWADGFDRIVGTVRDNYKEMQESERLRWRSEAFSRLGEASGGASFLLRANRGENGEANNFILIDLNPSAQELFRCKADEARGKLLTQVVRDARSTGLLDRYLRAFQLQTVVDEHLTESVGGLRRVWFKERIVPTEFGLIVECRDDTEVQAALSHKRRSQEMIAKLSIANPDLLFVLDSIDLTFEYESWSLSAMLGYPVGETTGIMAMVDAQDRASLEADLRALSEFDSCIKFRQADGGFRWFRLRCRPMEVGDGETQIFGSAQEVTRQIAFEEELAGRLERLRLTHDELEKRQLELEIANTHLGKLAMTDGLTGLKNHRAFQERLTEEVDRALRYSTGLSLLLADIDHFKSYNDRFGHPGGDEALRGFAEVLLKASRSSDIVVRYGGEEFALILPNTGASEAALLAERIRTFLKETEYGRRGMTSSLGCSELRAGPDARNNLVIEADRALYQSKHAGRDCVTIAEPIESA